MRRRSGFSRSTAAVTAMHSLPSLTNQPEVGQVIWIGMADPMRTLALELAAVVAPMQRPFAHVMVAGIVNDAGSSHAVFDGMDASQEPVRAHPVDAVSDDPPDLAHQNPAFLAM